ncbi:hypothetical protein B0T25DRAFT_250163 [Lasiosphaeria hispida]|uniref:Uncharacterized protein n=1 Tax=Lasiosphaeria hispida TaxID=260671 RepID=A0AAJ0MCP5_9PEZI|nr:hypothetical protein B0T25DRAFT_250163 [Lasiosphaeria hispida]
MASISQIPQTVIVATVVTVTPPTSSPATAAISTTTIVYTAIFNPLTIVGNFQRFEGPQPPEYFKIDPTLAFPFIGAPVSTAATQSAQSTANVSGDATSPGSQDGTSSPPSATTTVYSEATSSGTNNGLVAGVAVGCLIAGALLGLAAAFFFIRRRNSQASEAIHHSAPTIVESKAFNGQPPLPAEKQFQLSQYLLDSNADKEIADELRSLGTLIQQHVENSYHLHPVQVDPRALGMSLVQLGLGNGISLTPEAIVNLALEPRTRFAALQHVISQVVFSSIDVSSRSQLSMLPAPIAAFLQSIPPNEKGESNAQVSSYALNQWRTLSAFLLHPNRSQRTPLSPSDATVAPQAAGLANALNTFLGYFVAGDEASRFQQKSHLQAVVAECTKLGYVLLSQPSEWRFVHVANQQAAGQAVVVCAGLAKITHKDGTPLSTPQHIIGPTVVPV